MIDKAVDAASPSRLHILAEFLRIFSAEDGRRRLVSIQKLHAAFGQLVLMIDEALYGATRAGLDVAAEFPHITSTEFRVKPLCFGLCRCFGRLGWLATSQDHGSA
jgi:hypothetical protein